MDPFFNTAFWSTLIMLWIALIVLYFLLTSRNALQRKGYNEKYIAYLRRSHLIRVCSIAVVLPLLILLSAWIVSKITGPLIQEVQMAYIVVILVLLVVPFKYLDERINQKRIRELALQTNEKVAIDLNYKTLHLIFNPFWEVLLGLSGLVYGILFLKIDQWIVYLFLLFPWLMYLTIRGTRYQTRPYLMDNYRYTFAFNLFSYIFFLFFFWSHLIVRIKDAFEPLPGMPPGSSSGEMMHMLLLGLGLIVALGWIGRIAIYLSNYRLFNREISGKPDRDGNPPLRKLVFTVSAVMIFLTLSGVGLLTGVFETGRTGAGTVLQKYLMEERGKTLDTVAIETGDRIDFLKNGVDLNELRSQGRLRMFCTIELCDSGRTREFEICCQSTYEELPVGTLIKYECRWDKTITGLLDY